MEEIVMWRRRNLKGEERKGNTRQRTQLNESKGIQKRQTWNPEQITRVKEMKKVAM